MRLVVAGLANIGSTGMGPEIIRLFLSIATSVIAALVSLPITSDVMRGRLFGQKRDLVLKARGELLETIEGMVLSGQRISVHTYQALAGSISKRYEIDVSSLGSKDDYITMALQAINCSKALPSHLKRDYSAHLQSQLDGAKDGTLEAGRVLDDGRHLTAEIIDVDGSLTAEVIDEWRDNSKDEAISQRIRIREDSLILFARLSVLVISVLIGGIVYAFPDYVLPAILVMLCLAIFAICASMLVSLIGTREPKNIEFFRRLVYKIVSLIAITIFILTVLIFL